MKHFYEKTKSCEFRNYLFVNKMKAVNELSLEYPLFERAACRWMAPVTLIEHIKYFQKGVLEFSCRKHSYQVVMRRHSALETWRRLSFFVNCTHAVMQHSFSEGEYDYLCSDEFNKLCRLLKAAAPPLINRDEWVFKRFDREKPRLIPGLTGDYLIREIVCRPAEGEIFVSAKDSLSDKETRVTFDCPSDFSKYLAWFSGIHFGRAMILGATDALDMSCICYQPQEALRLGMIHMK